MVPWAGGGGWVDWKAERAGRQAGGIVGLKEGREAFILVGVVDYSGDFVGGLDCFCVDGLS
jgi:hypothetical protein